MITGNDENQIFARYQWNSTIQNYYLANNPSELSVLFSSELSNGAPINSLGLEEVYILTSPSTASASELLINCLNPYIIVNVIGDTTTGKNVASITLYDSPDFSRNNVDGSHRYAMQPIVLRTLNENGFGDYSNGIVPDTMLPEDMGNLGELGNASEPLLAAAISQITGTGRRIYTPEVETRSFRDSRNMKRFGTEMYIEDAPEGAYQLLKNIQ
jgi:C-terminal processing protease CtpA/Prc